MNDCGAPHRFIGYFTMYHGSIACANTDLTRSAFHNFHLTPGSHTGGQAEGHTHHLSIQRCFANFICNEPFQCFLFSTFFGTRYSLRLNVESLSDSWMATPNSSFASNQCSAILDAETKLFSSHSSTSRSEKWRFLFYFYNYFPIFRTIGREFISELRVFTCGRMLGSSRFSTSSHFPSGLNNLIVPIITRYFERLYIRKLKREGGREVAEDWY